MFVLQRHYPQSDISHSEQKKDGWAKELDWHTHDCRLIACKNTSTCEYFHSFLYNGPTEIKFAESGSLTKMSQPPPGYTESVLALGMKVLQDTNDEKPEEKTKRIILIYVHNLSSFQKNQKSEHVFIDYKSKIVLNMFTFHRAANNLIGRYNCIHMRW